DLNLISTLMDLSDLYEECLGLMISCYCLALLPLHSFKFKTALNNRDYWKYVPTLLHLVLWLSLMFISAQTNYLLKAFIPFARRSSKGTKGVSLYEKIDIESRTSALVNEVSGNHFGIRGIGFTVTYGLMGNMAGLLLTYLYIICERVFGANVSPGNGKHWWGEWCIFTHSTSTCTLLYTAFALHHFRRTQLPNRKQTT
ncbi:unnamed protein product, partial [Allacma fusca]